MLLFLYGEDRWHKKQKLRQLTDKFIREVDPSRINLLTLEVTNTDEDAFRAALRASPFLARKRMLVLKNFLISGRKAQQEVLREILPLCGEDQIVVVSEEEGKPRTWKNQAARAVWEYLEKNAKSEEFKQLWGAKLEAAILMQAKERGVKLEKDAAAFLAILSGGDLGHTEQELEKLRYYCGARAVTTENIKTICTAEGESSIFEFLDALGAKDQRALLCTAEEQLQESDALHLVARATAHLRALLAMKLAGPAGAQALRLHPFQAKKISAQLRHWDAPALKRFLFQLLTLEYAAKSGRAADPRVQLTALLAKI